MSITFANDEDVTGFPETELLHNFICTGDFLVVFAAAAILNRPITGATFNGVAMTQILNNTGSGTQGVAGYFMSDPPTDGPHDIAVACSSGGDAIAAVIYDCDNVDTIRDSDITTNTAGSISVTLTTEVGDMCLDFSRGNDGDTPDSGQTMNEDQAGYGTKSSSKEADGSSESMGWSGSVEGRAMMAISLVPGVGGGGDVRVKNRVLLLGVG